MADRPVGSQSKYSNEPFTDNVNRSVPPDVPGASSGKGGNVRMGGLAGAVSYLNRDKDGGNHCDRSRYWRGSKVLLPFALVALVATAALADGLYPGFPAAKPPLTGSETTAFDTHLSGGQAPQTVTVSTGQLAQGTFQVAPAQTNLTALAGGGRTGATALKVGLNQVATVATAADSVVLPACTNAGMIVVARNSAANAMQVFAAGSDTINGTAGATGVSQAATTGAVYMCTATGSWFRLLGASG